MLTRIREYIYILEWDWKDQPNWWEVNHLMQNHDGNPSFYSVETNNDEHAVVISFTEISAELATKYFQEYSNFPTIE